LQKERLSTVIKAFLMLSRLESFFSDSLVRRVTDGDDEVQSQQSTFIAGREKPATVADVDSASLARCLTRFFGFTSTPGTVSLPTGQWEHQIALWARATRLQ
jgi:hypothetical protein